MILVYLKLTIIVSCIKCNRERLVEWLEILFKEGKFLQNIQSTAKILYSGQDFSVKLWKLAYTMSDKKIK